MNNKKDTGRTSRSRRLSREKTHPSICGRSHEINPREKESKGAKSFEEGPCTKSTRDDSEKEKGEGTWPCTSYHIKVRKGYEEVGEHEKGPSGAFCRWKNKETRTKSDNDSIDRSNVVDIYKGCIFT